MTPYIQEQLENIRRTAERGLANCNHELDFNNDNRHIDTYQHILDIIQNIKWYDNYVGS